MKYLAEEAPRMPGRPLSFDRGEALGKAMRLFWRHGYEGTSLKDLTAALGVTPPSIYAAFGDKKRLFLEAVGRYLADPDPTALKPSTARGAAEALLRGSAIRFTGADTPAGCLVASGAISGSAAAADVQAELATIRRDTEAGLRERIVAGIAAGEMPADTDADGLAAHVMAVVQGLSTLARDGAPRAKLMRVVDIALQAWPSPKRPRESGRAALTGRAGRPGRAR